jgi:IMP-specific 5''-nucleotidase.
MTSRYRVEYALKSHRRDEFIEWIKGLLAVPFVLHSDAQNYDGGDAAVYCKDQQEYETCLSQNEMQVALECQKRYLEIFGDVEKLIAHTMFLDEMGSKRTGADRTSTHDSINSENGVETPYSYSGPYVAMSRLRRLVPSLGRFFTPLPLKEAFLFEDERRSISKRRLVSPSFNDVRMILNTAQIIALSRIYQEKELSKLKLVTFDGDVTLYEDGKSLHKDDPIVSRLVKLLSLDLFVGVVTAAGYPGQLGAAMYYQRLKGLVDTIKESKDVTPQQRENLVIMGGESNYLFRYNNELGGFKFIEGEEWYLPIMKNWNKSKIHYIMEQTHKHLLQLQRKFNLNDNTTIIRKERSIGIIPNPGYRILREHLEELVLSCSIKLNEFLSHTLDENFTVQMSEEDKEQTETNICSTDDDVKVCAFNGGSDVWVDIGDKSLGVECLQKYLCQNQNYDHICPILKSESLHIGDQFASLGANDFKARLSACTVWIASPRETVNALDDLIKHII